MSQTLTFVLCTERGKLEGMSVLFARSLRAFGGALRDAPIFSCAPRPDRDVSDATKAAFRELGVRHEHVVLNTAYTDYPLANKPLASAYAERTLDSDLLVFVDSDMLVVGDLSYLLLPPECDASLRPVDLQGIGVSDEHDAEYPYWKSVSEILGIEEPSYVTTTVDKKRIVSYFNSGMAAVRRSAGLFSQWAANFEEVMARGLAPSDPFYVEQSMFALTVMASGCAVCPLPPGYNYPIHLHDQMPAADRIDHFRDLQAIHYHTIFKPQNRPHYRNPLARFSMPKEQRAWVMKQTRETGVFMNEYDERVAEAKGLARKVLRRLKGSQGS